jgi:cytochrome P450
MSDVVYDPYDWALHEDPYPTYARLRDEAPAYHNPALDFFTLSRHADVHAALLDHARFSNTGGVALERSDQDPSAFLSFLAMDPPEHTRLRALVSKGFSPRRVQALEPRVRALAVRYIERFAGDGRCDFIRDFAAKVPMDVISEMLGVPEDDRDALREWADLVLHREPGESSVPAASMAAAMHLVAYFQGHVSRRRREPADDLTGALLAAELDGDRLRDDEVIAFLFLMVIAGNETTTKLLGNAVYWAQRNPDQLATVLRDRARIAGWVEETLRYDGSSQMVARTLTEAVTLHGVTMPAGARVALLIGSANRDPRVFERPDAFDVSRDQRQAIPMGYGVHYCLGASLAKLEGRVCLEEVLGRMSGFVIEEGGLERVHSSNVRGFAAMPLVFAPVNEAPRSVVS